MKNTYLNAEMEVVTFEVEDVISTSKWTPIEDTDDSYGKLM